MRSSATVSCTGKLRATKAENCIKHRETGVLGIDIAEKDKVVRCHVRRGRLKRVRLAVRAACDKRFDDNEYEATAYFAAPDFAAPGFFDVVNNHRAKRLRPDCEQPEPAPKCVGDVPRGPNRPFVVYLGYVKGAIRYVGITRQRLRDRCSRHRRETRSFGHDIRGLSRLGALASDQAHEVEQTVIESLGAIPLGRLENIDNSVSPDAADYCARVARGAKRLLAAGYPILTSRAHPRRRCP